MVKHKRLHINREIERLSGDIQETLGVELVRAEMVKENGMRILRIIINKEGGVGLSDCEAFSRAVNERLDEEDLIDGQYYLEVSSPGITLSDEE